MKRQESGFTLLEVLVATTIMGIAVAGLMTNINTSLRNASKLTDYDRASNIARAKMDELLLLAKLPHNSEIAGAFNPAMTGWQQSGFRATVGAFDTPPAAAPGWNVLERIQLEIWWMSGGVRRSYVVEAFRTGKLLPGEAGPPQ